METGDSVRLSVGLISELRPEEQMVDGQIESVLKGVSGKRGTEYAKA